MLILMMLAGPVSFAAVVGDMDGNGTVDEADLKLFFVAWHNHVTGQGWDMAADLDHNSILDHSDAELMVRAYIAATYVDPQALLVEAEDDLAANQLADAAEKLAVVIAAKPTWARPHGVLGVVLQLQGQATQATAEYAAFSLTWRTNESMPTTPYSDREGRFYFLLNGARISNGLAPLKPNAELALAAAWHSDYQRTNDVLTHFENDRPEYVDPEDRMVLALGWAAPGWKGENVAEMDGDAYSGSAAAVDDLHNDLMGSEEHLKNIMTVKGSDIGISLSIGPTCTFVTQDFAELPVGGEGPGIKPAAVKAGR
jgi:uncharacterized protein YkwD